MAYRTDNPLDGQGGAAKPAPGPYMQIPGIPGIYDANDRLIAHMTIGRVHGEEVPNDIRHDGEALATIRLLSFAPDMQSELARAAAQFRSYEQQHRAKGTPDADSKAATNRDFAARIEALLARVEGR